MLVRFFRPIAQLLNLSKAEPMRVSIVGTSRYFRPLATLAICMLVGGMASGLSVVRLLAADSDTKILILIGPSTHPPGTHEVAAGGRLLEYCLEHAANVSNIDAQVITQWPTDAKALKEIDSVVFTGDRFPPAEMAGGERVMQDLTQMMQRGCGLMCYHYATGLGANHVPADGAHPLLDWMGGYFATKCVHHQSVAKIFEKATITPTNHQHPALNGWKTFTVHDEPYIKNYFGKQGLASNVTPLAMSMLPPEDPQPEIVAWAVSRDDGGRGVGVVMPHFYRNWRVDDLRKLILNGIVWTAKRDVPAAGVLTTLPPLETFQPESVEPIARAKK